MSREWQQTRMHKYVMPNAVYYQTLWAVRDLSRMEARLEELKDEGVDLASASIIKEQGARYRAGVSEVEDMAMETAILQERIDGIRKALSEVPKSYRSCIIDNIVFKEPVAIYPNKMWKIWKQKFLYGVAKNLSMW